MSYSGVYASRNPMNITEIFYNNHIIDNKNMYGPGALPIIMNNKTENTYATKRNENMNYNNSKAHEYSLYNLEFLQTEKQQNEFRNRYNNSPDHSYSYMGKALYRFNFLNKMNLELSYRYAQNYKYTDRSKYRLDQIDEWDNNEYYKFGTLPSSRELLRLGLDRQISYTSGFLNRQNQ